MENETKTAGLKSEATDRAFKKERLKLSFYDKIYITIVIISLLTFAVGTGLIIAEKILK